MWPTDRLRLWQQQAGQCCHSASPAVPSRLRVPWWQGRRGARETTQARSGQRAPWGGLSGLWAPQVPAMVTPVASEKLLNAEVAGRDAAATLVRP